MIRVENFDFSLLDIAIIKHQIEHGKKRRVKNQTTKVYVGMLHKKFYSLFLSHSLLSFQLNRPRNGLDYRTVPTGNAAKVTQVVKSDLILDLTKLE